MRTIVKKSTFEKIREPQIVGAPGTPAHMDLVKLDSGEIRHYGVHIFEHEDGTRDFEFVMKQSFDYGLSWEETPVHSEHPGPSVKSPWSGEWIILHSVVRPSYREQTIAPCRIYPAVRALPENGVWCFRSAKGPDGPFTRTRILKETPHIQRLPLPLKQRKRWIVPAEEWIGPVQHPVVLISDDDGFSWTKHVLPPVPRMEKIAWPHRGMRWSQCGCEPVIAELPDGRLQMLVRTSADFHYQCFSSDGGESWSRMERSPFYSVATMPNLVTLSDGRLLAVWNNTTPLPEFDQRIHPDCTEDLVKGIWEDVFTNRDALHAAISEDCGRSWIGFREIALNPIRNAVDFRTVGGSYALHDKSIHQNQVLELPDNKVLVSYGQHPVCQALMIFDLDFLYADGRRDDFRSGLSAWSVQQYFKGHIGGFRWAGHCAWNRRAGARLMPSPDNSPRESLLIGCHPDPDLYSYREGAVWNFPAAECGELSLRLTLRDGTKGLQISLCDRWINPSDPIVHVHAGFVLRIAGDGRIGDQAAFSPGQTGTLILKFSLPARQLLWEAPLGNGRISLTGQITEQLSYLHLQSLSEDADYAGVMIDFVEMKKKKPEKEGSPENAVREQN